MVTKLTLTLDKDIIGRAKEYARKSGRSLSDLVESYLEQITGKDDAVQENLSPRLKNLFGKVQIPQNLDHKVEIRKILAEKDGER